MERIQEEKVTSTPKKKINWKREIFENVKTIGVTVLITLFIINFVAQIAVVRGESMANTFHDSNIVMVEKLTQRFSELKRFQVIIFNTHNPEKPHYIKRIIGLPGETVKIDDDGNIYINGELLEEYYGREIIEDPGMALNESTLGEDEYFCLGDNRNNSIDSRFEQIGSVKKKDILGHVFIGLSPWRNPDKEQRK